MEDDDDDIFVVDPPEIWGPVLTRAYLVLCCNASKWPLDRQHDAVLALMGLPWLLSCPDCAHSSQRILCNAPPATLLLRTPGSDDYGNERWTMWAWEFKAKNCFKLRRPILSWPMFRRRYERGFCQALSPHEIRATLYFFLVTILDHELSAPKQVRSSAAHTTAQKLRLTLWCLWANLFPLPQNENVSIQIQRLYLQNQQQYRAIMPWEDLLQIYTLLKARMRPSDLSNKKTNRP